ncbi:hypothetical protein Dimus_007622 [Dionaea muscipula]
MVLAFPTPERYQFGLPEPGKSMHDQDTLCIHLEHFTRGLRLPLPYLLIRLLNRHDLLLAQLTPNAISYILAFIILCEDKAVESTSCLFDTIFSLVEEPGKTGYCTVEPKAGFKLVQDLPETHVIWKRKFITVRRKIPVQCFLLYGMTGSKQRLAAMRRLRKKTSTQLEAGSGKRRGFWDEIEWLIKILPASR